MDPGDPENVYGKSTGLFNPNVNFQTPLISYTHGLILKPFGMVRDIGGWFCLVYNEAW